MKTILAFAVLLSSVIFNGCVSPEEQKRAEQMSLRAPQDREAVLDRLKSYKAGETTFQQFQTDADTKITLHDTPLGGHAGRVWWIFSTQIDIRTNGESGKYLVGYSGGPLAELEFKDSILATITFR